MYSGQWGCVTAGGGVDSGEDTADTMSHHVYLPFHSSLLPYLLLDVDLRQALQAGSMLRNSCKTQRTLPDDVCALPRDCSIVY